MANSIKTWTPDDYANAAGRKLGGGGGATPNAMDFMSRLSSNVSVSAHRLEGLRLYLLIYISLSRVSTLIAARTARVTPLPAW